MTGAPRKDTYLPYALDPIMDVRQKGFGVGHFQLIEKIGTQIRTSVRM